MLDDFFINENDEINNFNNKIAFENQRNQIKRNNKTSWFPNSQRSMNSVPLSTLRARHRRNPGTRRRKGKGVIRQVIQKSRRGAKTVGPYQESYNHNVALDSFLIDKEYNQIYLVSDIHFFKEEIKYNENKVKIKMNNFKRECNNLQSEDILIFLGDIAYRDCTPEMNKKLKEFLKSISCTKILILGNHDNLSKKFYRECGFIFVEEELIINNILFTHIPADINKYKFDGVKYNIHGHIHGNNKYYEVDAKNHFDVYTKQHHLLNLEKIMNLFERNDY